MSTSTLGMRVIGAGRIVAFLLLTHVTPPVPIHAQADASRFRVGAFGVVDVSDSELTIGIGLGGDARLHRQLWVHANWATAVSGISGLWWGTTGLDWIPGAARLSPVVGGGAAVVGDLDLALSESEVGVFGRAGVRYRSDRVSLEAGLRVIRIGSTLTQLLAGVAIPF